MLSYQHSFHAGNHADILKHSILCSCLTYLSKKETPFTYIDTHAGCGLYNLQDERAQKTQEAQKGIQRLLENQDWPEELQTYKEICSRLYASGSYYAGSPELARLLTRETDNIILIEKHPAEFSELKQNLDYDPRVHIHHRDGFSGLLALSPPTPRRGICLMDPSYETAEDYTKTAESIIAAHKRWPVGMFLLWYPIVKRKEQLLTRLKDAFRFSSIPNIVCVELSPGMERDDECAQTDEPILSDGGAQTDEGFGLLGSGVVLIQPPWTLENELHSTLPYLASSLGEKEKGSWSVDWLTEKR